MKFLSDDKLYASTKHCLQFLRRFSCTDAPSTPIERCHLYWCSDFALKQAFAIKSFLATQDLQRTQLWLWLDAREGYEGFRDNPLLRPLLPFINVKRFDADAEAEGTPLEKTPALYRQILRRKLGIRAVAA
jgi:hypothetical protein